MKLYEYYKLRTNEDGKPELYTIPDPLPQDGFSYEPLAYACDDDDYDEDIVAKNKWPFTGINTNFSGNHGSIDSAKIVPGIDTVTADNALEYLDKLPTVDYFGNPIDRSNKEDTIFYRTGIYYPDEEYTGLDVVYCIVLDY